MTLAGSITRSENPKAIGPRERAERGRTNAPKWITQYTPFPRETRPVMVSDHTPGPWAVMNGTDVFTEPGATNAAGEVAAMNDGWQVCDAGTGITFLADGAESELTSEEQHANAHLIAAAPDLLEALEECAADLEAEIEHEYARGIKDYPAMRTRYERDMDAVRKARAAIAKARGES